MSALKKSIQSEVICTDGHKQCTHVDPANVCDAPFSIYQHIEKSILPIKHLSENRTSGTIILCAIDSARRLNEKLQHGGIQYAHCH